MISKLLNNQIKGKYDMVNASVIQMHLPEVPMQFTKISTGHFMFCQNNHPVIINRGEEIITIEAKDIQFGDKIWVDNTIVEDGKSNIEVNENFDQLNKVLFFGEREVISKYVLGNGFDIRFVPEFIDFDRNFIVSFLLNLQIKKINKTESFNLLSQLKLMADMVGLRFESWLIEEDRLYFGFSFTYINFDNNMNKFLGYFPITSKQETEMWKFPVYDIKTSSSEFIASCVQTHNSFHTGGTISFDTVNIQKELMTNISDNFFDEVKKSSYQKEGTENILYLSVDTGSISINTNLYEGQYKITDEEDHYLLPIGIFDLTFGESFKIPVSIDRIVKVFKTEDITGNLKTNITIKYKKDDKIFHASSQALDYSKATQRLDELISGKAPTRDVSLLYGTFYRTMAPTGGWDSVHLEVLISNCLRWSKDPQIPARLKRPYDPTMFPIKQLPSIISWPIGLAFENMGAALQYGLISERGETSEIEKTIIGEPLSTYGKESK